MAAKTKIKPGNIEYAFTFRAMHKYARLSPFKARYIMDAIRHKYVNEALTLLKWTNRRSSFFVDKVLRSAIANSIDFSEKNDVQVPVEKLIIKEAYADEGSRIKRWRARSRGIANPIIKRTCHLIIEVGLPEDDAKKSVEKEEIKEKIKKSKETLENIESQLDKKEESAKSETEMENEAETEAETDEQVEEDADDSNEVDTKQVSVESDEESEEKE